MNSAKLFPSCLTCLIILFIFTPPSSAENTFWQPLTSYQNEYLSEIAFPLGGIGTGTVSMGGRGNLRDWEIMNRPSKGFAPEYGFFSLWTQWGTDKTDTRVIEGILQPPYTGASGIPNPTAGLPRFREVNFHAAYPFCRLEFKDPSTPLAVQLEAFNPLIPLDPDNSGLPVAVFRFRLTNLTNEPVKAAIAGSLQNFIGNDGVQKHKAIYNNDSRCTENFSGLFYSAQIDPPNVPQNGTIALIADGKNVSFRRHWARSSWRNDLLSFWDDFSEDGVLTDPDDATNQSPTASLANFVTVPPAGSSTITFMLCWHFPNRTAEGCGWSVHKGYGEGFVGNYYTTGYKDAWDAAEKIYPRLASLEQESIKFVKAIGSSTLPQCVKEAALNNLSTLRSQVCFRTPDGHFFGFEGDNDKTGCCMGSCAHVWNYQTADAFVYPSLARSMRDVELRFSTHENGMNDFRTRLPLIKAVSDTFGAAADGQMGVIMKLYREWQISGDASLLRSLYPAAKEALSYAWIPGGWDANQDGVMEGVQHNTYDVEFYGPNPMMAGWYLGALRSAEEMANAMNDREFSQKCRMLFERGKQWIDHNLFNGEYYVQQIRPVPDISLVPREQLIGMGSKDPANPDFQVGAGCLVDQLAGQYMAHVAGMGYLLDSSQVKKTAQSIYRYNFKTNLYNHFNNMRTFALNDESALLICSWPFGGRPKVPFPYFSEVMTGFEYQAAVLMMYEGLVDEGISVVKAIRARFDGKKRNPWNEPECGHHYARAMTSWSSILALSGFHYSGVSQSLSFKPEINPDSFQTFWCAGTGWGTYSQQISSNSLNVKFDVQYGKLELKTFRVGLLPGANCSGKLAVLLDKSIVNANCRILGNDLLIEFPQTVAIDKDKSLELITQ